MKRTPLQARQIQPDAFIIKAAKEKSHANILRKMKPEPKLSMFGDSVNRIRRTATSDLLKL